MVKRLNIIYTMFREDVYTPIENPTNDSSMILLVNITNHTQRIHPFCVTIYEHARFDAQATTTNEVFGVIFSYPIAFPKTWKETLEKGHVDSSIEPSLVKHPVNQIICVYLTTQNKLENFNFLLVNESIHGQLAISHASLINGFILHTDNFLCGFMSSIKRVSRLFVVNIHPITLILCFFLYLFLIQNSLYIHSTWVFHNSFFVFFNALLFFIIISLPQW